MELEDLEDLGPAAVTPRVVKRGVARRKVKPSSNTADDADVLALSNGDERTNNGTNYEVSNARQHSVYVKTYGCSHNSSDSEYMSGLLQQHGYLLVDEQEKADVWLINSCTVKNPSEEHMVTDLKRGRALGKKLVVAGCVSQAQPDLAPLADVSLVGVQQLERVVEVVHESLQGRTMRVMERAERPSLNLPKVRRNPLIEIIPVNTGCLGSCTYCSTVYARGRLGSYEPAAIEARLASAYAEGVVEVWLTSEDTGAYGRDIGTSMPELLARLLKAVPEGRRLRVGMTNPPYILQHLDAIAELLNHPRCYAFLHVPVQSGSDGVLGRMRREYTCAEFCAVADALQAKVRQSSLSRRPHAARPRGMPLLTPTSLGVTRGRFQISLSQRISSAGSPARRKPSTTRRSLCSQSTSSP